MNLNNTYKIYDVLVTLHTPGHRSQEMGEAIKLSKDVFIQRGHTMRIQKAERPNIRDLLKGVFNTGSGRKICTDTKDYNPTFGNKLPQPAVSIQLKRLRKKQKLYLWAIHQSVAFKKGRCSCEGCLGIKAPEAKKKRAPETNMR